MSEPGEFEFVPRKRAVQDSVAQIGNHTSKSEALTQSETALNAGETENNSTDQLEQDIKGNTKMHGTFGYWNKFQTNISVSRKELRKYWKEANHCFSTAMLFKLQDWDSTRPWIPRSTTR